MRHPVVKAALVAGLLGPTAGCFFTTPINSAPSAEIQDLDGSPVYKGSVLQLDASKTRDANDSFGSLTFAWTAAECDSPASCDAPYDTSTDIAFRPTVMSKRLMVIGLRVTDPAGASDLTTRAIKPINRAPVAIVQVENHPGQNGGYTIGRTLSLVGEGSDVDGDATTLTWELFVPPASVAQNRLWRADSPTQYTLRPDVVGQWEVRVTASDDDLDDPLTDQDSVVILMTNDEAPCIQVTSPLPSTDTLPSLLERSSGTRRFRVENVGDELDPYPLPVGSTDAELGGARFRWFLSEPSAPATPLPVTGHDLADFLLDPSRYLPGDRFQLRVEIADRTLTWPSCPEAEPSCSRDASSCVQRTSWFVEIR